jgi:hypothetical protein
MFSFEKYGVSQNSFVGLSAEIYQTNSISGFNTYRVYANFADPSDELNALYGVVDANENSPWILSTLGQVYQNSFGGLTSRDINPDLFPLLPDLEYDSYFGIGEFYGNENLLIAGIESQDFDSNGISITDEIGGVIFTIPGTVQEALAGPDLKVFLGQFTVSAPTELLINFQYYHMGIAWSVSGAQIIFPEDLTGCMEPDACNYDPLAVIDSGSCFSVGDPCDDGFLITANDVYLPNCSCLGEIIYGCTDVLSCDFNPLATVEDGSCLNYTGDPCDDGDPATVGDIIRLDCSCLGEVIPGCTNSQSCNYDPMATFDDGSCLAAPGSICDDNNPLTVNDIVQLDCSCLGTVVPGCTDPLSCDFDPTATVNDGSCEVYPGSLCDDGNADTANDLIQSDCSCSGIEIPGCRDNLACNYDPLATVDNGMCYYFGDRCDDENPLSVNDMVLEDCSCEGEILFGCMDPSACNFDDQATVDNGHCSYPGDTCDIPEQWTVYLWSPACQCELVYLDSDLDGIYDYLEVQVYGTDPFIQDSDYDGLTDGLEINYAGSNPLNPDSDGDGCWDHLEYANLCPDSPPCDDGCPEDLTGDGIVNTADLLDLLALFGYSCP